VVVGGDADDVVVVVVVVVPSCHWGWLCKGADSVGEASMCLGAFRRYTLPLSK